MFAYYLAVLKRLKSDRKGVTAMEYGVIAAVTVVTVGASIKLVGEHLSSLFGVIAKSLGS